MCQNIMPPDEENICLRCAYSIYNEGDKIKPDGYAYYYTMCSCRICSKGRNIGHRKTCHKFLKSEKKRGETK